MNRLENPYAPGAGTPPPELAGRDALRETARISLERIRRGRSEKSLLLIGLRGVGKTVLLERIRQDAEATGIHTVRVEAPESRSLPALLAPHLRQALIRLSRVESSKALAQRGLNVLAGFARALKIKYGDIEVGIDLPGEAGTADNGDLELDLAPLLEVVGEAARGGSTAITIFIDELQYVEEDQLAALISALHHSAQRQLPVCLIGAGLPQLRGRMGRAKSYAERLFEFSEVGPLSNEAATQAIEKPAAAAGVHFEQAALDELVRQTQGYPYFLQEWGKHTWDVASKTPIVLQDVHDATTATLTALDESFFRVRFDRLTPQEKRYLRAMAELGPGPHRSGDVADALSKKVTALGPARNKLIAKGMIWSPSHGDTAFTVPLFDEFMRRIMPGDDWRMV